MAFSGSLILPVIPADIISSVSVLIVVQIVFLHCGQTQDEPGSDSDAPESEKYSFVYTGDTVTLICEERSTGRKFLWHKISLQPQSPTDEDSSTFRVTVSDEGTAEFTCAARRRDYSTETSDPAERTVKVLIVLGHCGQTQKKSKGKKTRESENHREPEGEEHQSSVCTGDTVTLICEVGSTGWEFLWRKSSPQLQPQSTEDKGTNTVDVTVDVTVSDEETTKTKCAALRGDYSTQLSDPAKITIKEKPNLTVSVDPQSFVYTGDTITLTCEVKQSTGWEFLWYNGSQQLQPLNTADKVSVTVSDEGTAEFRCEAHRGIYYTQLSDQVMITVKERPKPAVSIQPDDQVFRGETVTLRCDIQGGGVSNWQYSWFKDGSSTHVSNEEQYNISPVTESDRGKYTCGGTVRGTSRYSHTSDAVTLTVSALPRATLTVEPRWSPVFTGESVTLKCEIQSHSNWGYHYNWRYQLYKGSSRTAVSQSQTNTFTIRSAADQDQDQYWCRGESKNRPSSSQRSNTVTLTVKERPKAVVSIQPDNQVFRGETVTLRCDIRGGGVSNWQYSWFKDGPYRRVSDEEQYRISPARKSDIGKYTCRGTERGTSRYSHTSDAVTLTVSERPRAVVSTQPDDQVFSGETVTLRCDIRGGGVSNWQYSWFKAGSYSPVSNEQQYRISPVTESDRGTYTCRGTERGTSRYSHTSDVTLTVSALPTATLTVEPRWSPMFTGESVTLKCEIQSQSNWRYQWYKGSSRTAVSQSHTNTFTIRSAADQDQYWCRGERANRPTSSQHSNTVTLRLTEKPKPELTSSHKGAVLIGNPVVLYCKLNQSAGWKFYWSKHTQSPENETKTETHSYTISSVSVSDGGQYWCRAGRGTPVYYTHYSDALWINMTNVSSPVSLMVSPSRAQHFITDSLSLSCEGQSDSAGWRVRRYTHSEEVSDCSSGWGSVTGSTCNISSLSTSHTGVYWCESESGESSNSINIKVHSAIPPVSLVVNPNRTQHFITDSLSLSCEGQSDSTGWRVRRYTHSEKVSNCSSGWGSLTGSTCNISSLSTSHTGVYWCESESGESSNPVNITVTNAPVSGASFSVFSLLSSLMAASPYLLVTIILVVKFYRTRA
ncbi:hypothetical protein SRHO_G00028650 [Serrasalmus rhombeus]